jgi:hypothetical protein
MSLEEIVRFLNEGKAKGYLTGELPNDPEKLNTLAQAIQNDLIYQASNGTIGDESGRQHLLPKRRPTGDWDPSTDRRLPMFFGGPEWSALFRHVLHAHEREPFDSSESIDKWSERQRVLFKESLPKYPMLGRIWDTYIDVQYQPDEVLQLRDECLQVRSNTSNPVAIRGLEKLNAACEEALRIGSGLLLISD